MTLYKYAIALTSSADSIGDAASTRIEIHSTMEILASALQELKSKAASYNVEAEIMVERIEPQPSPYQYLALTIDEECRKLVGIIDGAVPDYDDARMNDLERNLRNQMRQLNQLGQAITQLTQMVATMTSGPAAAAPMVNVPAPFEYTPAGMPPPAPVPQVIASDEQLTPKQIEARNVGRTLIGTPPPFTGDMSAPIQPRTKGITQTAEQASDQLVVHGPKPTSSVMKFAGVDKNGQGIFVAEKLPVVGDTLRSLSSQSDIKPG